MQEKVTSSRDELIRKIVERGGDGLQGRKILRERLQHMTLPQLRKEWHRGD